MIFNKKMLFASLLGFDLLTGILVFTNVNFLYTTTLIALCTYVLLPGLLISLILGVNRITLWEHLILTVGLGLIFLEMGGLLLNILLPLAGVKDPLSFQNTFFIFNIYIFLLFIWAWRRASSFAIPLPEQLSNVAGAGFTKYFKAGQPVQPSPINTTGGALKEADTGVLPRKQFSMPGLIDTNYAANKEADTLAGPRKQFSIPGLINPSNEAPEGTDKTPVLRKQSLRRQSSSPGLLKRFSLPGLINTPYAAIENADTIALMSIQTPRHTKIEKVLYTLPVFFPLLAIVGAIVLNNGGSNLLTLILLGAIAFYALFLVLLHNKISSNLYPYAIFFIGLALLFTTSLRSWYITGHDIEEEFYVFQLTTTHHLWSMAFYQDPYNACLSITILPTVLSKLLAVPDMYVYKVIFQLLFATSPLAVFFILRNYTTPVLAFLATFFFMSFPTFFNDMAMLNRQEIGFIFFGLMLYIMLLPTFSLAKRRILFLIFGLGVIVSHYSTNFVVLPLMTFVYISTLIFMRPSVQKIMVWISQKSPLKVTTTIPNQPFLRLSVILLLFLMTFAWNNLYTNSSNHAASVLAEVVSGLFVKSSDSVSGDVSYSIFSHKTLDPQQEIQETIQSIKQIEGSPDASQFYSASTINKYPSIPASQEQLAPTPLGNWLSALHVPVFDIQAELRALSADFMQLFVFIGLIAIFFLRQQKKPFDLQYLLLCFGAILMLMLEIVLPSLSVDYGLLRMFQQCLFVLSLPIVLGLGSVFFFVKEQKRTLLTCIVAIVFFLNLTGFIAHLTGDYYPQMTLDNAGLYYDAYYVHKSDIVAIIWLSQNDANNAPINTNLSGANKLLTFGGITPIDGDYPAAIEKNAYVIIRSSGQTEANDTEQDILYTNTPIPFLDNNKDTIYSNGQVKVYK